MIMAGGGTQRGGQGRGGGEVGGGRGGGSAWQQQQLTTTTTTGKLLLCCMLLACMSPCSGATTALDRRILQAPPRTSSADEDAGVLLSIKSYLMLANPNVTVLLATWNTTISPSPCHWTGVACALWEGQQRVTQLRLFNMGLAGPIPPAFSLLPALTDLNLACNAFNGSLPAELGVCTNLLRLDVSSNHISGSIPSFLAGLPNVQLLNLSSNVLNGSTIDVLASICASTAITRVSVSGAGLVGIIPPHLGDSCKNLQTLDLSFNSLEGQIPASLGQLLSMQQLSLGSNTLSGPLPPGLFANCAALEQLDLSFNLFDGPIPSQLATCSNLLLLNLQGNALNGTLPSLFNNMTSLEVVALGDNGLWGGVTDQFANCHNLTFLEMHSNYFTGPHPGPFLSQLSGLKVLALNSNPFDAAPIPVEIASLQNLVYLDLSHNSFVASIPEQLSSLVNLDHLILAGNNLTGSIPSELGYLARLQVLDLSYNQLTGTIPASFGMLQELLYLGITSNLLTGPLPPELGDCQSLLWLSAFHNRLNGSIPDTYYRMGNKALERFHKNRLAPHVFPAYVGECSIISRWVPGDLTEFILENLRHDKCKNYWNVILTGVALVNPCSQITPTQGYLELAYNQLSGPIPDNFGNFTNLGFMYMQENQFVGSIPDTFADLPLSKVNLSHNLLSGPIPDTIGYLNCLILLDLAFNNLSGPIPTTLAELKLLTEFNVSYNVQLTGPIPNGPQFYTFGVDPYWADCGLTLGPVQGLREKNLTYSSLPLCQSPRPWPLDDPSWGDGAQGYNRISPLAIAGITLAGTLGMLLLTGCVVWWVYRHRTPPSPPSEVSFAKVERDSQLFTSRLKTHVSIFKMSLPSLTYEDLAVATNSFDDANVLGSGGFGTVYKAMLADSSVVAIKKLTQDGPQGIREFKAEMETLGQLKHENLVPLLGYCCFGRERILVYRWMKNGSVEEWLHEKEDGPDHLDWPKRLKIALGTARGLDFLHNNCSPLIIHRDMKGSNILLDEFFNAHVTDFGLARLMDVDDTHVSTTVAGTLGYVPPEYSQMWRATVKGDVYSFGVVLLELATGKRPVGVFSRDNRVGNLVEWVRLLIKQGRQCEAFAPIVTGTGPCKETLQKFLLLAVACCEEAASKRPNMCEIVQRLQDMQGGPDHLLHDILEE